jgi:flagellar protein FlbD
MISLTRLSGSVFALNPDLIERIDRTPDTVITLLDGSKYVVAESLATVVAIIRNHRAEIVALSGMISLGQPAVDVGAVTWPPGLRPDDEPGSRRPSLSVVSPVHPEAASSAPSASESSAAATGSQEVTS